MNLADLFQRKNVVFSLEVFPPKKDSPYHVIYDTLLQLRGVPADFISVTYGAGGSQLQREKTVEMASLIKTAYGVIPVAHLTCVNTRREQILETLDNLRNAGVWHVLTLRGDLAEQSPTVSDFAHASDLAQFIRQVAPEFHLLGACYPEKHAESANLDQDLSNLKNKVDSGVSFLITQCFFDNALFYNFRDKATAIGIDVPIEAGIMPVINEKQIEKIVSLCGATIPDRLSNMIQRYRHSSTSLRDAGIEYATEQILDLIDNGIRGIHLFTMNNVQTATRISENIQSALLAKNELLRASSCDALLTSGRDNTASVTSH